MCLCSGTFSCVWLAVKPLWVPNTPVETYSAYGCSLAQALIHPYRLLFVSCNGAHAWMWLHSPSPCCFLARAAAGCEVCSPHPHEHPSSAHGTWVQHKGSGFGGRLNRGEYLHALQDRLRSSFLDCLQDHLAANNLATPTKILDVVRA